MKHWIIADTHFGHDNIKDYGQRPDDFEDRILKHLKVVQPEDVLIHLGDVAFYNAQKWNMALRNAVAGKMWLVRGNHDKSHSDTWFLKHGWDFVGENITLCRFKKTILLSHKPMPNNGYDLNIHGHLHNIYHHDLEPEMLEAKNDKQHLVAMEHHYQPIRLRNIAEKALHNHDFYRV